MEQDEIQLCGALEALLFAAGYPVSYERLAEVMETDVESVRAAAAKLCDSCAKSGRGIQLIDFGDSCQLCTKEEHIDRIRALLSVKRGGNLSRASLEVLAIIAYHQPVTKSYIEQIRGIDSTYAVNNLTDKQLIEVCGRLDAPGRPALYRTNENFLRLFGLSSIVDLPPIEVFGVPDTTGAIASGDGAVEVDAVGVQSRDADEVGSDEVYSPDTDDSHDAK